VWKEDGLGAGPGRFGWLRECDGLAGLIAHGIGQHQNREIRAEQTRTDRVLSFTYSPFFRLIVLAGSETTPMGGILEERSAGVYRKEGRGGVVTQGF
jgi:hypothetical protein